MRQGRIPQVSWSHSAVYLPNRVLALAALADEWMATSLSDLQAGELLGDGEEADDGDYEDGVGRTELMDAAAGGHTDTVTALLAAPGIDVNAANGLGGTALMLAADGGHAQTVTALLVAPRLDVNAVDDDSNTALMYAVSGGHTETVMVLLAAPGLDVNAVTGVGSTALAFAEGQGHIEIAFLLRSRRRRFV